jgi:hypothetical protein
MLRWRATLGVLTWRADVSRVCGRVAS